MKFLLALPITALLAFCAFGFLHSFEPGDGAMAWRVTYSMIGTLCLVALALLLRRRPA